MARNLSDWLDEVRVDPNVTDRCRSLDFDFFPVLQNFCICCWNVFTASSAWEIIYVGIFENFYFHNVYVYTLASHEVALSPPEQRTSHPRFFCRLRNSLLPFTHKKLVGIGQHYQSSSNENCRRFDVYWGFYKDYKTFFSENKEKIILKISLWRENSNKNIRYMKQEYFKKYIQIFIFIYHLGD